jgi:putative glutamine amidotransferase
MHGGTLLQDIATQRPQSRSHREPPQYERHFHHIELVPGTRLAELYPGVTRAVTNSIHHQGIKELAPGFVAEAHCPDDGMIEAIRKRGPGYVAAVQWHPEFHDTDQHGTFDDGAMLQDFLAAARAARRSA